MAKPNQKLDKNGKPVTGYAAFVAHEWSEINKTRTEKVTRTKFIAISKVTELNQSYMGRDPVHCKYSEHRP